jgi:hypothetical protein
MTRNDKNARRPSGLRAWLCVMLILPVVAISACDSLLEVENPNNVKEEDLSNPTSAAALSNGLLNRLANAYSNIILDHGAASDELRWVGSRDAYRQLDLGNVTDPNNEFSDATFPTVGETRWWADEVIKRLEEFRSAGTLAVANEIDLARAYLYAAVIYVAIADHYDDFVITSDRREPGQPVGEANMSGLYDTAIGYVDKGLAIARARANAAVELQLMAMRTRANFQKGVWAKVNPRGTIAASPLVNSAAAEADARAVLTKTSDVNWRWILTYANATTGIVGAGAWVNNRLEFRLGNPYINPTANDKDFASTKMTDLIETAKVAPALDRLAREFDTGGNYPPAVVISAREIQLILAEIELAKGNTAEFANRINLIRSADGLAAYSPTNSAHPAPQAMLIHMRRTNLFMQARRLMDHYRFRDNSSDWLTTPPSDAVRTPGSFFPITRIERESNPNVR